MLKLGIVFVLLACALAGRQARAEMSIETDFGAATEQILTRGETANPNVTGLMSGQWRDDTSWAPDVQATWAPMEEEGRRFLRLQVTHLETGRYQLTHALPRVDDETFYRLSFTARSVPGAALQIGVRDSDKPYAFHWETRVDLTASWRDYSYEFRLDELPQDVGFWINPLGAPQVDLARFSLSSLKRTDYVAELKRRYAQDAPKNLMRVSRFPLGLQSGWALGRDNSDGDDVNITADAEAGAPSGAPAMRIQTAEHTVIYTAPFAAPVGSEPHTASMYVRGSGQLTVFVLMGDRGIGRKTFELAGPDKWRRVHLTFQPELMAPSYCLRLEFDETLWLDGLQVELGSEPTEYASRMPCEVSLACPASDASMARVQFDDEPAVVSYCVTGPMAGGRLAAKVVNAWGQEQYLGAVKLPDAETHSGRLAYDALAETPLGPFRIEAWVQDGDGQRISSYNELVVNRLPRPRHWGRDAPDSPFGVHTNSTTRHNLMAKAVGANWTRLHDAGLQYLGWYFLERKPGQWTFRDKEIKRYRRDHIKVLGELGTAPEWASYFPGKAHNGYFDRFYQPKRMEDYANYVRTVCRRYQGIIDAYDVWNEPWIASWWAVGFDETKADRAGYVTSEVPQADFVRLMKTAYETAKSVDDAITILGVNTTTGVGWENGIGGNDWTRGVVQHGGMDYCDVVCYHQYIGGKPGYEGDVVQKGFAAAVGPVTERFGKLLTPVWMTEGSAARDTIGAGLYNHTLVQANEEDVSETADRLCRYVVSVLAQGVERLFLYSMHAQGPLYVKQGFRAIVTPEGYLHPSGAAHAVLAWHLEGTRFVRLEELCEGVYAYLFEARDGSGSVAALSGKAGHAEYYLPRNDWIRIRGLFGNPVPVGGALGDRLVYASADRPAEDLLAILQP